ncbi:hypothetical protein J2TS6_31380 [Paenibacillus albilobatus]|uniref:Uncharacterized protein n=1 Tax=Paenibacillus albilobatus TaxID=2716884 RepID=A0A919XFS2_9BACL|nr:hypothetical protein J2TS6_31380 [Paenibacillus albilobatus]
MLSESCDFSTRKGHTWLNLIFNPADYSVGSRPDKIQLLAKEYALLQFRTGYRGKGGGGSTSILCNILLETF